MGVALLGSSAECPRVNLCMAIAVMVPNQTVTSDGMEVQVLYIFFKTLLMMGEVNENVETLVEKSLFCWADF